MEKPVPEMAKYEIDALDRLMLSHLVKFPKTTLNELAELTGLTKNAVHSRKKKPAFQAAWSDLMGTTNTHLEEAARRAARRLKKLVDHEDPKTAEPFIKMALSNHLGQKLDVTIQPTVTYKTTVQPDGSLIQEVLGPAAKTIEGKDERES